jgi:hypothetical protein
MLNPRYRTWKSSLQFKIKVLLLQLLDTFDYRDCLGQVFSIAKSKAMAPTSDDIHEVIAKLEARVKELEARLLKTEGGAPSVAKDGQSIRMILMGPPGAGKSLHCLSRLCDSCLCLPLLCRSTQPWCGLQPLSMANLFYRKGHTGSENKGEILMLPSGELRYRLGVSSCATNSDVRLRVICFGLKSRRRHSLVAKQRRLWTRADS